MNTKLVLQAWCEGTCSVLFTETGFKVLRDTRKCKAGYLHLIGKQIQNPPKISQAVIDQLGKFFFERHNDVPSIGSSPQIYFNNLTREQFSTKYCPGKEIFWNK